LQENGSVVMDDPFIREHIEELLRNIRIEVLMRLIKPYVRIKLSYLVSELKIDQEEIIRLLIEIIHDKCQELRIDQVNQTLVRIGSDHDVLNPARVQALNKVSAELESLKNNLVEKFT